MRKAAAQVTGATLPKVWLVSDFVTVGAALAHAHYLMCNGTTLDELKTDFERRVGEREYPVCPPQRVDSDGLLSFTHWQTRTKHFNHGGLFGLTRWTNLYFPLEDVLWGDAIGGELAPIFGPNICDLKISTLASGAADFFTHTAFGMSSARVRALRLTSWR